MSEDIIKIQYLEAGDTTTAEVRGTSATTYSLEPTKWLSEIMDAAKQQWFFANAVDQQVLQAGQKDFVVPIRKKYLAVSDFANTYSAGAVITATKLNNLDGIRVTPAPYNQRVSIENHAIRTNGVNLIAAAKDDLTNYAATVVDVAVATAIRSATMTTDTVNGAQLLYGGDATTDATLVAGDTLTPEMISQARTYLMSKRAYFWSGGVKTLATAEKNPWNSINGDPFALFVSPEVAHKLRVDPQFIDSSNYGSNEVVMTGEIGKFVGVKVIESVNVPVAEAGATAFDGGANTVVAVARCLLCKPKKAATLGWGLKPTLTVSQFARESSMDIVLELTYQAKVTYGDAIVFLDVALD